MDGADSWHHVMNRGIARRPLFEKRDDIRFFQAELARAVRRGEIEIHSFSFLTTHYHMLVRCPRDGLGKAMQQVQTKYSRRFNRGRKRDGSLVRGRYGSKLVESLKYRVAVVRYIDRNAVEAGLCRVASDYAFGSASFHSGRRGAPWLERSWVQGHVRLERGGASCSPADYARVFVPSDKDNDEVVELRMRSEASDSELDDLIGAAPQRVLEWFRRKARLADGTRPGLPVVGPTRLRGLLEDRRQGSEWTVWPSQKGRDGWTVLAAALNRDLGGATFEGIGRLLATSTDAAHRLYRAHQALIERDETYAATFSEIAAEALRNPR